MYNELCKLLNEFKHSACGTTRYYVYCYVGYLQFMKKLMV